MPIEVEVEAEKEVMRDRNLRNSGWYYGLRLYFLCKCGRLSASGQEGMENSQCKRIQVFHSIVYDREVSSHSSCPYMNKFLSQQ